MKLDKLEVYHDSAPRSRNCSHTTAFGDRAVVWLQILMQGGLTSNSSTDLKALNFQFWQGISLQQLRTTQTSPIADNLKDLTADFWPVEDSIEDFLTFLRQQRQDAA